MRPPRSRRRPSARPCTADRAATHTMISPKFPVPNVARAGFGAGAGVRLWRFAGSGPPI
ncbi:hypothetical protein SPHINGO361_110316 [Sphingomonas sp. EC-HK361]|nr:hypothetical protein SPHINGO361_110316 [Sphingomonas sp. EC-HK361]